MATIINQRTGTTIGDRIEEATSAWTSFRGLMLRKHLHSGEGMVFRPARGIHTHFMRFPIDLVFFDKQQQVAKVRPAMRPWRMDFTSAAGVIELPAGLAAALDIQPGDQLIFQ